MDRVFTKTARIHLLIKTLVPVVDVVDGVRSSGQSEEGFGFGEGWAAIVVASITIERAWPGDRA